MTAATTENTAPAGRGRDFILLLGSTMTVMAAAVISPALPTIATTFAAEPNAALLSRLALTMPALFIALVAPFAGFLLDRIGRRPVVLGALLLYGLAGTAGLYLQTLPALLVSRAFLGIAIAGTMSGFTTLIGDFFTGSGLDRFMGLQATANSIGGLVFLVLGGVLAELSWHAPFLIYSIAFLVLPLFWWFVPEPEETATRPETSAETPQNPAIPWPTIIMLYALGLLVMLLFYMIPVQIPFALQEMDISGTYTGLALGLMALISAFTAAQYQTLHSRFSFPAIFVGVFGLMAAGYILIAMGGNFFVVLAGLFVAGIGLGPMLPNLNVWLVNSAPAGARGRLVSGLTTAFFMGQFLSPIAAQPVVDRSGTSGIFLLSAAILLLLALAFFLVQRRHAGRRKGIDIQK
jgi:MFS family permease